MEDRIEPKMESGWKQVLNEEFNKPYFHLLKKFLLEEKQKYRVYPPGGQIFAAFNHTPFSSVRVVLLGQDPYHGQGQAHGLCFSVPDGIAQPPSLVNIFKELHDDAGIPVPRSGNLTSWALQGVLLLNATLTVRANQAGSHQNKGWETFTDTVISVLSEQKDNLVFILWGKYAQAKKELIDGERHLILSAAHPSPLSAYSGFFGCRHFTRTNEYLNEKSKGIINWSLS